MPKSLIKTKEYIVGLNISLLLFSNNLFVATNQIRDLMICLDFLMKFLKKSMIFEKMNPLKVKIIH